MELPIARVLDRGSAPAVAEPSRGATAASAAERSSFDPFVEEFRVLALNVMAMLQGSRQKAITVFSHGRGEGRTLVAVELARALAGHTDVLLIGGHPTAGGLHESVQLTHPPNGSNGDGASRSIPPEYRRIPLSMDPRTAWREQDLWRRIEQASADGVTVIIDAPASESSSDAFMLAQRSKNVLYVIRNKPQDMAPHRRAMDHLRRLDTRILGIVLNDR